MKKSERVSLIRGLVVVMAVVTVVGCSPREEGEPTTQTKSAVTTTPPEFTASVVYPTGSRAEAVALGDLDGDGRRDVALTTSVAADPANDRMLNVFLQDVDGTLKPRVQYPLGNGTPRALDIGDVNGDGRADAVVGNSAGAASSILVLLQTPSGTLDAPVAYPTLNADHVKVGDFNGDGRMDVAGLIAGNLGDGLDVFLQTAAGTLAPPVTYHVPHGGFDELEAGDVTGDGRTDLVVRSGANGAIPDVSVLAQASDGTLAAAGAYHVPGYAEFQEPASITITGIAIGDVTGDGRNDVLCSKGDGLPGLAVLAQDPQGTLALYGYKHSYPGSANALVFADVDGDGYSDVASVHFNAPYLVLSRQTIDGLNRPYELYSIPNANDLYRPDGLAVGDINSDSLGDVAIADPVHGLVVLRRVSDPPPKVTLTPPASGLVGAPIDLTWTASADALSFEVTASFNGGPFAPIAGCQGLAASARGCNWASPGPAATGVRVRVTTVDAAGYTGVSQATLDLIAPTLAVTVTFATVTVGATTPITWTSNLPASSTMRIELSRDGGPFTTIAAAAPNTGTYLWTVTGPPSFAQVRVTSNGPVVVSATGTASLRIVATPIVTVTSPAAGSTVVIAGYTTVTWTTSNVALPASVTIAFSPNGGATFFTVGSTVQFLANGSAEVGLGPTSANAQIRVTVNPGGGQASATGTSGTFALVTPTVAVTNPVAGTTSYAGTPLTIGWTTNQPANATARIELSRDAGATYTALVSAAPNTGTFSWTPAGPDTSAARVRVTVTSPGSIPFSATGTSGTFAIVTPTLAVTSPAAGSTVYPGTALTIGWSTNLPASTSMRVELSRDGGATYETLADSVPNTGSFVWTVAGPDASNALVRVSAVGPVALTATGGGFAIVTPMLAVTSPASGVAGYAGTPLVVSWTTNLPPSATARIELSRDGGATYETLADAAPNTGSFLWIAAGPDATAALARVTVTGGASASGTSGAFAIVTPTLAVTSPAAGSIGYAGTALTIGWSSNLPAGTAMRVELSRDGGGSYELLAEAAPNTGSLVWTMTGPETSTARVRVSASSPVASSATSAAFTIVTPALAVTSPASGSTFHEGTALNIGWTSSLPAETAVRVELSRDGGGTYETLAEAAPNTGSFVWTVAGPETVNARVRISAIDPVAVAGTSASFAIAPAPQITVTAPGAGASWALGTSQTIAWTSNLSDAVRVELSRDGGASYTTLAANAPATGSLAWTVTGAATPSAIVRVSSTGALPAAGTSGVFAIGASAATVTSPATDARWTVGVAQTITWTSNLPPTATVRIQLSRNGGSTFTNLTTSAPNSGSFAWTPTGAATTTALIRVTVNGTPSAIGVSGQFTLAAATVTVTSPNTAVVWSIGSARSVTWTHNLGAAATFKVELTRDAGASWSVIAASVPSGGESAGSYDWTVAGPATIKAKLRVTSNGPTTANDKSDVNFKIQ